MKKKFIYLLISIFFLVWVIILVTDTGIFISEVRVRSGEDYYIEDYGNLGDDDQDSLVCKHFNGRKVLTSVFWYSPNNILGRNSCPFLYK